MAKPDMPLFHLQDLPAALGLLSRFPIRINTELATQRGAYAAWAWPIAGLVLGAVTGAGAMVFLWLGLPIPLAALLTLTLQVLLTGALHEDGLADCADGLWGGYTRERRLEIMKDSRIGAYGVIAIALSLAARLFAIIIVLGAAFPLLSIMAVAVISRLPMAILIGTLPNARGSGLAQSVGQPPLMTVWASVTLALMISGLLLGAALLPVLIWVSLTTLTVALVARQKIGGQTGDILGASQQLAEIASLFTLASLFT